MKHIQLINDDYKGYEKHLRHACRGILMRDGQMLLSYESKNGKYNIPGGGVKGEEALDRCCERELLDVWRHINHYFVCEFVEDTGVQQLTEAEMRAGYQPVWLPLKEAMKIFGNYEAHHKTDIADYGRYRREFTALKELEVVP